MGPDVLLKFLVHSKCLVCSLVNILLYFFPPFLRQILQCKHVLVLHPLTTISLPSIKSNLSQIERRQLAASGPCSVLGMGHLRSAALSPSIQSPVGFILAV